MDVAGDGAAGVNDLAALLRLNRTAPQRPDWIPAEMLASPLEAGDEGSSPADLSALPEELRLSSLTLFPFPLPRTLPIGFGAAKGGGGAAGPGSWSTVRVLSLAGNGLEHLPDGFGPGLSGLQVLWLDSNALVSIAPAMFPPSLQAAAVASEWLAALPGLVEQAQRRAPTPSSSTRGSTMLVASPDPFRDTGQQPRPSPINAGVLLLLPPPLARSLEICSSSDPQ